MNISFRRNSVATGTPEKNKEDEDDSALGKKTSFNFGDMGKNLNFKKMFQDKEKSEGKQRAKSNSDANDPANTRMKEIMSLLEEFRLQCPPTHAGLVVAFTATTLSPLSDPDIKYKWYRMDKELDQFLQIDQGSRGWYPPTADDIGKKICAQCEDVFEQGYCRYAETGPVEADPLLRSMLDSALENGSYAMKDVSASLGVNVLDPEVNSMVVSFDMQSKQRFSALEQSPSPIGSGGFAQFEGRIEVEVDTSGVFLSFADINDGSGLSSPMARTGKKGLLIKSSPGLTVECALPASLIIAVPLPTPAITAPVVKSTSEVDGDQEAEAEEKEAKDDGESKKDSGGGDDSAAAASATAPEEIDASVMDQPWEWVGETSGPAYEQVVAFFNNINDCVVPEFRICLACSDRMQRDAMALSFRCLAALGPDVGMRQRMTKLPWIGVEQSKGGVQSMAGSELGTRLKDLENENQALKRERDELNLQLLENGLEGGASRLSSSSGGGLGGEGGDDAGDESACSSRAKIRQLENDILTSRRKEMEVEQNILEKEAQINRLEAENESKEKQITELTEKLSQKKKALVANEAAVVELKEQIDSMQKDMKSVSKEKKEANEARSMLREMENELVSLRKSLADAEGRYNSQIAETRVIAAELLVAQNKATEIANKAKETTDRCEELQRQLDVANASRADLQLEFDIVLEQKKTLEEAAQTAELYEEALDSIDKLEGERNHWQHKSESLAKDVKRLLKQMEDLHNTTSYQLKESSRALEMRNEDFKNLEASIAARSGNDGGSDNNGGNKRMSIFGRIGKKGEDANK